jgi:hypothetical protein
MSACGRGTYDVGNETDRLAMKIDIRNALTVNNCSQALDLSSQLYNSSYSDNDTRMLYASAHACNVGINLYNLIDQITASDFSSADQIFKSLVRLFPSRTALDTRLQSGWFAQDALQAILKPGAVIGAADRTYAGTSNPGSVLIRDRTDDANMYLVFVAMSEVGTNLNRYGFNASDDPAALNYAQQVALPWLSEATVQADTSGAGCGLASSLLNMFDGIHSIITLVSGDTSTSLNQILTTLESAATLAGTNACLAHPFTAAECQAGLARLRFRSSCFEQASSPAAAAAAGINSAVDLGWQ